MLNFVFWNVGRRSLDGLIAALAGQVEADFLILAEHTAQTGPLLSRLESLGGSYHAFRVAETGVKVLSRLPRSLVKPVLDGPRVSVRQVELEGWAPFLLAGIHLPSKRNRSRMDQHELSVLLCRDIERWEERAGHSRTVVVGDFNMNPFEDGMVSAGGFHGMPTRSIAAKGQRRVDGKDYSFFYNPMWSLLGDRHGPTAGTYYYQGSGGVVHFWNLFDQVLVRPELLPVFDTTSVRIITQIGEHSLIDEQGRPDATRASDHLPIAFTMEVKKGFNTR